VNLNAAQKLFRVRLMHWHYHQNTRSLPWKLEKDPYRIWLSEIILQQTRAEQGLPYYLKFIEHYPDVVRLANARDEEVFRLWQGLGYYARCRNLLATARHVAGSLNGEFPRSYEGLLALKGIGAYTAAAIASFAWGLPHAVVDGNVIRVLSRVFGIDVAFDTTQGKKQFSSLADLLLDRQDPAGYNQAIMDHGATVCTPVSPDCPRCPFEAFCIARSRGLIAHLPVRSKKLSLRQRYFQYILFSHEGQLWVRKRTGKDIWQNLYEPFLIESEKPLSAIEMLQTEAWKNLNLTKKPRFEGVVRQRLTHQQIETNFYSAELAERPQTLENSGEWVSFDRLKNYAFPRTLVSFLEKKLYF